MSITLHTMTICIYVSIVTHNGTAVSYKLPKLFVSCTGCDIDNIAFWAVHINNHSFGLVILSIVMLLMSQGRCDV